MTIDQNSAALSPTAIPAPVRPMLRGSLGSLAFVAVGVGIGLLADGNPLLYAAAVLVVGFFGFCGVLAGARLWSRAPALVITDRGLEHRVFGAVSWEQISHVSMRSVPAARATCSVIDVVLHEPSAIAARAPGLARMATAGNMRRGLSPLAISAPNMAVPLELVLTEMVRHHPSLRVAQSR